MGEMAALAVEATDAPRPRRLPAEPPLVRLRKRRNISKADLVSATGFERSYLSHIEYGDRDVEKLTTINRLAKGYGVTVGHLLKLIAETLRWKAAHVQRVHVSDWHVNPPANESGCSGHAEHNSDDAEARP